MNQLRKKISPKDLNDRWPRAYDSLLHALQTDFVPEGVVIMESCDWQDVYVTGGGRWDLPLADWVGEQWILRENGWELNEWFDAQEAAWEKKNAKR